MQAQSNPGTRYTLPLHRLRTVSRIRPSTDMAIFAGLTLVALGLRLWELDGRTMHYDEAIHVNYAWRMATGDGFSHSPWMHGPFQIHLTAFIFKLFSDSDFTARLTYVLFGSALVFLPFFLRTYLGRTGAIVTAVLLTLSPAMLYFSRFGRNEILMSFFALALLILMWRYLNEGKNRYLYMASAVLALMFASKETSYIVVVILGAALFLMSLPEIVPWALGRIRLSEMSNTPAFLILMDSLSLPLGAALITIPLASIGMELVAEGTGEVGLPVWGDPFYTFPMIGLPTFGNALILATMVAVPVGVAVFTHVGRRWAKWLVPTALLAALIYAIASLPNGIVGRDYLVAIGTLAATLAVSAVIGLMWRWKVWLLCAGIFYFIWLFFYTSVFSAFTQSHGFCPDALGSPFGTLCSRMGGVFTGSWQSLGYWVAQQEVARGGQPWYYYYIVGSVYEFLHLLFGTVAIVYYLRRADLFGIMLAFWAVLTFLAYTIAGEKMPWLIVNITLPFILLAGKFIGDQIEWIRWKRILKSPSSALLILALPKVGPRGLWLYLSPSSALLVLAPLILLGGMLLLYRYLDRGAIMDSWQSWGLLFGIVAIIGVFAYLVVRARPRVGITLASLGIAALLLGFSTFVAFRATYNYADTPIEMLVYAQGSADLVKTVDNLEDVLANGSDQQPKVEVDYEIWYPMTWYVRHEVNAKVLQFNCYKDENEPGYVAWCNPLEETPSSKALLLIESHGNRDSEYLSGYEKSESLKNILWFPENTYRRAGEDRRNEALAEQLDNDFHIAKDNISRREPWKDALD
ncbi:MAG: TIGR03663 family protein, partial [Dehalococcoidia bacterium]|nr:TIGR03663 family protein [Dehalococcoidia bacterium]